MTIISNTQPPCPPAPLPPHKFLLLYSMQCGKTGRGAWDWTTTVFRLNTSCFPIERLPNITGSIICLWSTESEVGQGYIYPHHRHIRLQVNMLNFCSSMQMWQHTPHIIIFFQLLQVQLLAIKSVCDQKCVCTHSHFWSISAVKKKKKKPALWGKSA